MNKRSALFLTLGLAVVGVFLYFVFFATEAAHLRIEGKILKVRVWQQADKTSLVFVDFRAMNPSNVLFVTGSAKLFLATATGETQEGTTISKPEVNTIFEYQKIIGPKYNDVLSLQDRIAPHATLDRMIGAQFTLPEDEVNRRRDLRIHLEDVDGTVADIVESGVK